MTIFPEDYDWWLVGACNHHNSYGLMSFAYVGAGYRLLIIPR